jgi:hypothetical protein
LRCRPAASCDSPRSFAPRLAAPRARREHAVEARHQGTAARASARVRACPRAPPRSSRKNPPPSAPAPLTRRHRQRRKCTQSWLDVCSVSCARSHHRSLTPWRFRAVCSQRKLSSRSDRVKSVDIHPTEPWVLSAMYNGENCASARRAGAFCSAWVPRGRLPAHGCCRAAARVRRLSDLARASRSSCALRCLDISQATSSCGTTTRRAWSSHSRCATSLCGAASSCRGSSGSWRVRTT